MEEKKQKIINAKEELVTSALGGYYEKQVPESDLLLKK